MDTSLPVKYRFYSDVPVLGSNRRNIAANSEKNNFSTKYGLANGSKSDSNVMDLIQRCENEGAESASNTAARPRITLDRRKGDERNWR